MSPRTPPGEEVQHVEVAGRRLRLTSLSKVMYPATGTTKAEVIDYLVRVSEPLQAQLADRPVTRIRWPHGVEDPQVFFEKNAPAGRPSWVRTVKVPASDGFIEFPVLDDVAGLVWVGNLNALELHTPQWTVGRRGAVRHPDRLVVDLDPGEGTGLDECAAVAHLVAERLADDGLECMPVTSGGKGLQLYAPLAAKDDAEAVRAYAEQLARGLARDHRRHITATMTKSLRTGKVLIDWSQNHAAKTTITPYSLRGRRRPTVAAPRTWDEITEGLRQLEYPEVLARLESLGDLMEPYSRPGPRLP